MIIKRFFEVNSNEIVIFKSTSSFSMKNLWLFNIFEEFTYLEPESGQKTSAPAPAKSCRSTGSATLT
jgi:hypothetical protein